MGRLFHFGPQFNSRYGDGQEDRTMKIVGMPERFWVVCTPKAGYEIGDFCFECDFGQFALQVRGGLEVESIVGIFSDRQAATNMAVKLLREAKAEGRFVKLLPFLRPVTLAALAADLMVMVDREGVSNELWAYAENLSTQVIAQGEGLVGKNAFHQLATGE